MKSEYSGNRRYSDCSRAAPAPYTEQRGKIYSLGPPVGGYLECGNSGDCSSQKRMVRVQL